MLRNCSPGHNKAQKSKASFVETWLSSGMLHHVISYILTNILQQLTASIIRAMYLYQGLNGQDM
jgi:hypothetical protein